MSQYIYIYKCLDCNTFNGIKFICTSDPTHCSFYELLHHLKQELEKYCTYCGNEHSDAFEELEEFSIQHLEEGEKYLEELNLNKGLEH